MEVEELDYINVPEQAAALGCNVPTGLALLPRNFDVVVQKRDLIHESSAPTVRTLWREAGINETKLEQDDERYPQISEKGLPEWVGPTVLVTFAWLSQNPAALSIALGVISNYVTEIFLGLNSRPIVRMKIVVENKNGKYKSISYKGPVDGMKELSGIVKRVVADD